jgi:hypothetical protein
MVGHVERIAHRYRLTTHAYARDSLVARDRHALGQVGTMDCVDR